MRFIPVDTSAMTFVAMGGAKPKIKDPRTGEVRVTEDGRTLYTVVLMAIRDDEGEQVKVTVAAAEPPVFRAGMPVRVEGLEAFGWETKDPRTGELRHGIAFRAASVTPLAASVKGAA
ncbi:hypothetical protein C3Y87_11340 [Carbonactinospora thermoautotrophica]|uniref:SCO3933 family regulatory protein n=1 Tax=Carbonactinospora thermoautotrophica TaxID=1469144 RepID=UPI002270F1FB|nr:hypothetical protein [Carbonactinospora thermoautotrophica]MCX9191997.1 hypothetical protein [Carbonactinospora thermoautotrophica]